MLAQYEPAPSAGSATSESIGASIDCPACGVTSELAKQIGTSAATLSRIERGARCDVPTFLKLTRWMIWPRLSLSVSALSSHASKEQG